jgi:hypothetical protein
MLAALRGGVGRDVTGGVVTTTGRVFSVSRFFLRSLVTLLVIVYTLRVLRGVLVSTAGAAAL